MTANSYLKRDYPNLLPQIRALLQATHLPYIIENVPSAPLHNPITLCGTMFNLRVYRHRRFESNVAFQVPVHPKHTAHTTSYSWRATSSYKAQRHEFVSVWGKGFQLDQAREAMGISWMNSKEIAQAIPPAYTKFLAAQVLVVL